MAEPRYAGLQNDQIPTVIKGDGAVVVKVIAGDFDGTRGGIDSLTGHLVTTIELAQGSTIDLAAPAPRNVFFYVVRGELHIGGEIVRAHHLVHFSNDADDIAIEAMTDTLVVFGHADPIGEPVVAYGPFVMNSREEIIQAVRDYEAGMFR